MSDTYKRQAKSLKKQANLDKLHQAQLSLAFSYGFADYHEFQKVHTTNPNDDRLLGSGLHPSSRPGEAEGWKRCLERQSSALTTILKIQLPDASVLAANIHGFSSLSDVQYTSLEDVFITHYNDIDERLGDLLSGAIAETNAYNFSIDHYEFNASNIEDNGVLTMNVSIQYTGEQDPDRPWCGTQLFVDVDFTFDEAEDGEWSLLDMEIDSHSSDFDIPPEPDD